MNHDAHGMGWLRFAKVPEQVRAGVGFNEAGPAAMAAGAKCGSRERA